MWLKVLPTKDCAADAIKQYQVAAEAKTGRKLWAFCSNKEGSLTLPSSPSTVWSMVCGGS